MTAISTLNSSLNTLGQEVTNGSSDMAKYSVFFVLLLDPWINGVPCISGFYTKVGNPLIPYIASNRGTTFSAYVQLAYDNNTNSLYVSSSWNSLGSSSTPTISRIIGIC